MTDGPARGLESGRGLEHVAHQRCGMAIQNGGIAMVAKVGDRIVVESEKMDVPPRDGEILEVIPHDTRVEFRVRWSDGHQSGIRPVAGTYRINPAATPARA